MCSSIMIFLFQSFSACLQGLWLYFIILSFALDAAPATAAAAALAGAE